MNIKKAIDKLVGKERGKEKFSFSPQNYRMREIYDAEKLVVGKLEYISSDATYDVGLGPMILKTSQNYIFEPIMVNGIIKYQEVFTGFIAWDEEDYFDLPYVVDMEKLTEILVDYKQSKIPKLGMLLTLNEVNSRIAKSNDKKVLKKSKENS